MHEGDGRSRPKPYTPPTLTPLDPHDVIRKLMRELSKPSGCHGLPRVLDSLLEGEGMAKVQLYCNPATSEVAAEHPTLHDAIAAATPSVAGALLICDGVILATAVAHGWLFEPPGIERLHNEFASLGN